MSTGSQNKGDTIRPGNPRRQTEEDLVPRQIATGSKIDTNSLTVRAGDNGFQFSNPSSPRHSGPSRVMTPAPADGEREDHPHVPQPPQNLAGEKNEDELHEEDIEARNTAPASMQSTAEPDQAEPSNIRDVGQDDEQTLRKLLTAFKRVASHDIPESQSSNPVVDPIEAPEEAPVSLFRIRTMEEGKSDRLFYSDQPFSGLKDPTNESERSPGTIFDVVVDLVGKSKERERKITMKREDWWRPSKRIDIDKDFDVTQQRTTLMNIWDKGVRWAIRSTVKYDPGRHASGEPIPTHHPFPLLMWNYTKLEELHKTLSEGRLDNESTTEQPPGEIDLRDIATRLEAVLSYVKPVYETSIAPEKEYHEAPLATAKFEHLWLLYKPGELAYVKVHGQYIAVIIIESEKIREARNIRNRQSGCHCRVSVWNYRFVNGRMVRHMSRIRIDEYQDRRQINTLPVFPSQYHDNNLGQKQKLRDRGRSFFRLVRYDYAHMQYEGKTLDPKPREYKGHIVIDPAAYLTYLYHRPQVKSVDRSWHERMSERISFGYRDDIETDPLTPSHVIEPEDSGGGSLWRDLHEFDPREVDESKLEDRHYMLFPRNIMGMTIKYKQWAVFDVAHVKEIEWPPDRDDALRNLMIPVETKQLLKAACPDPQSHIETGNYAADWISGKGAGQVLLLYGPPGTGKTFTVECMAEYNRQMLLSLTVGDIGTEEINSEVQLLKWFDLARKWQAILSIDEADIFLGARQTRDLPRNGVVSVFLRTMEYYEGTMFLTTNSLDTIDEAIRSRVQVAIRYKSFPEGGHKRRKIWRNSLTKLEESTRKISIPEETAEWIEDEASKNDMNAREIRNVFNFALQIAESDPDLNGIVTLTRAHLQTAITMREQFNKDCVEN